MANLFSRFRHAGVRVVVNSVLATGLIYGTIILIVCLVCGGAATAQNLPTSVSAVAPQLPSAPGPRLKAPAAPGFEAATSDAKQTSGSPAVTLFLKNSAPGISPGAPRRITLEEAQQQATTPAANPMIRLAQLQIEVAKQARLGTRSSFFPQIGSTFTNFHFNKFMGQEIQLANREVGLPLAGKDQTFIAVTATQPVTPLFQLRQLYKINQADERIAMSKAGMPVAEIAGNVEKNYYGLLVAQRQLAVAEINAKRAESKWLVASNSATPMGAGSDDEAVIEATKALATAKSNVEDLTDSLDNMMGLPSDTELELVPPDPRFEDISLSAATEKAMAANPDVIEAEQTLVKARAASTIQKLSYVPVVAVIGGYAYNDNAIPLLPRDFSFIGVMATYNLFDFGKREHTIKGSETQAEMAELALQLTKAKVAAAVKSSHLEVERDRELSELTRRLDSEIRLERASFEETDSYVASAKKAKVEAEMFQADLDYRQALAKLKTLIGEQ